MNVKEIFRKLQNGSDVRGAALAAGGEEKNLTPSLAAFICRAYAGWLSEKGGKDESALRIGVGHDSRITAEAIKAGCLSGLSVAKAFDCGLVSTPAMFQSTLLPGADFDGAVMITASHLPFNRNGLKFFTKEGGLEKAEIRAILDRAAELAEQYGAEDAQEILRADRLPDGGNGAEAFSLVSLYAEHMRQLIIDGVNAEDRTHPLAGLHIAVDAGNGAAGFFATDILAPLGADISGSAFLDPDGHFPNHVPNPENPAAIDAIRKAVLESHADLGVIFDCDGDRGAVVFSDGTEVNRNTLIALLAAIINEKKPGTTVVTDSVTSDELHEFLVGTLHMKHLRFRRGYKNVIDKGIELNRNGEDCELAIETSGHGAFRENHFSDDGAYIAVKIIIRMAQLRREHRDIRSLIAGLRYPAEARELRFHIAGADFGAYGDAVLRDFEAMAREDPRFHIVTPNYEGIRVSFDDPEVKGWLLLRKSLHDPVLPVNVESRDPGGVEVILGRVMPFFRSKGRLSL